MTKKLMTQEQKWLAYVGELRVKHEAEMKIIADQAKFWEDAYAHLEEKLRTQYDAERDKEMNDRKWNETDIAIKMAKRALDIPNADPDDDLRTISRQFLRSLELLNTEGDKAIDSYRKRLKQAITSEPEPIEKWSVEEIMQLIDIVQ